MEKASQIMFNLRLHRLLPFRNNNTNNNNNNNNNNNRLITLLQPQVQGMVLFPFVNQIQHDCHTRTGKLARGFLPGLEKLEHFSVDFYEDQRQCPEKLDFNMVRLHGSHWRKAHPFSQLVTLTKQRCQISSNALNRQRYHLTRKLDTLVRQKDQLSLNALTKQRNQLRMMVSSLFIPNRLMHVRMEFLISHREFCTNCMHLGCTRAMGSRKAVDAFCRYVDSHPNRGLWYEIQL